MARIPRGKFGTEFLSDEQERQVLRFVRTLGLRHPELERALTEVCLQHPGFALGLAEGPTTDFNEEGL